MGSLYRYATFHGEFVPVCYVPWIVHQGRKAPAPFSIFHKRWRFPEKVSTKKLRHLFSYVLFYGNNKEKQDEKVRLCFEQAVTRGRKSPLKLLSPPWKMCWTCFESIGHSLKIWAPIRKLFAHLDVPSCLRAWFKIFSWLRASAWCLFVAFGSVKALSDVCICIVNFLKKHNNILP